MTNSLILTNQVAGPYQAFYNHRASSDISGGVMSSVSPNTTTDTLGIIGDGGIRELLRIENEDVPADLLGKSVIDQVYLGGQLFLEFILEEVNWKSARLLLSHFYNPNSDGTMVDEGNMGVPGTFYTTHAGKLNLVPLANTKAAATTDAQSNAINSSHVVRQYPFVVLASNFELEKLLSSSRRKIPVRLRVIPFFDGTNYKWYNMVASAA